jgi:alpha-tubulin suppressor-like RCC1 family protein
MSTMPFGSSAALGKTGPAATGPVWLQVSGGQGHTCGVRTDHTLWCWGWNGSGQLGLGNRQNHLLPQQVGVENDWQSVAVGSRYTCGIRNNPYHSLWCWGRNKHGELGLGDKQSRTVPTQVGRHDDWQQVSTGVMHTCGIRSNESLWCWGSNSTGELGVGGTKSRLKPSRVGSFGYLQVDAGLEHTCGIQLDHTLWCWGWDGYGQLGVGDTTNRVKPTQVGTDADWQTVSAAGYAHSCATRTDGTLWCWGWNVFGQLGVGDYENRLTPTQVGIDTGWVQLTLGDSHTCATRVDETLWCWGNNSVAQLGLGYIFGDEWTPVQVGDDADWQQVGAGRFHTCGVRVDSTLWCWGANDFGQLGLGYKTIRYAPTQV